MIRSKTSEGLKVITKGEDSCDSIRQRPNKTSQLHGLGARFGCRCISEHPLQNAQRQQGAFSPDGR